MAVPLLEHGSAKHLTDDCFLNLGQYRAGLAQVWISTNSPRLSYKPRKSQLIKCLHSAASLKGCCLPDRKPGNAYL
ncbi:unnamed protein product [Boreogadus saida]